MNRILIAGVGNIFKGDDAFGVEVVRRMAGKPLPAGVVAIDFGVRGIDLTYALLDGCQSAILVDAVQRGEPPGTLYVIEPEPSHTRPDDPEEMFIEPHNLDPAKALQLVKSMGGCCQHILLVGCEPAELGDEETGAMGLSPVVEEAVDRAVPLIEKLVRQLLDALRLEEKHLKQPRTPLGGLQ